MSIVDFDGASVMLWHLLGAVGTAIFYSRFWVQWIASERQGKSTIPPIFWYLSCIGTLTLLAYAIVIRSPLGALSQCFNIVVYTRNIIFIGRKSGRMTPVAAVLLQGAAAAIAVVAILFVVFIWRQEFTHNQTLAPEVARETWGWLALGVAGQALFAGRFLIQWIASERRGESTVPPIFWYLSVIASALQAACFLQRGEWLFLAGTTLTLLIYLRNIMLLNSTDSKESAPT